MNSTEQHFPCAECGSQLGFGPGQKRLVCSHCGKEQAVPSFPSTRLGAQRGLPIERVGALPAVPPSDREFEEFSCPNCGARTTFDGTSFALNCPYCGTSISHPATEDLQVWPKAILPFAVPEAEAYRSALAKLQDTTLTPADLASDVRLRPTLKGVYLPFWVFGAGSETAYTVNRGKYEIKEVTVEGYVDYERRADWSRIDGHLSVPLTMFWLQPHPTRPGPLIRCLRPGTLPTLFRFSAIT